MLNSLQACRAAAALLVVFYHASHGLFRLSKYFGVELFGRALDFGFAGVDFFFVLSGFIIMYVHMDDIGRPRAFGQYLWKRLSRIYPAYWVVLAAILPVYFFAPHFGSGHEREPDVIVRAALLFPHPQGFQVIGVAWSLVFEVFFYLLFGLLILNKRLGIVIFAAWSVGVIAQASFKHELAPFVFSIMNFRFITGVGVALFLARWQMPMPRIAACIGISVFVGTGLAEVYGGPLSMWEQCIGFSLGSALMVAGFVQAERSGLIEAPGWLVYLGNASYSIYLVHFLALSAIAKIAKSLHLDQYVPLIVLYGLHVVLAVAVGCAFHHLVERPLHTWAKRRFRGSSDSTLPKPEVSPDLRAAA